MLSVEIWFTIKIPSRLSGPKPLPKYWRISRTTVNVFMTHDTRCSLTTLGRNEDGRVCSS